MGKNKNRKKNQSGGVQKIPGVGLQTAHFKSRQRNMIAVPDTNPEIQVVHESVFQPEAPRVPVSQRLGQRTFAAGPVDRLPAGMHCKTGNFTARNYSTCMPTGEPQIPGVCDWCSEYYFDLVPHFLSFHELDSIVAISLARSLSLQ